MNLLEKIAKNLDINLSSNQPEVNNQVYPFSERLIATFSYVYFAAPAVLLFSTSGSGFVKLHAKHSLVFLLLTLLILLTPFWFKYFLLTLLVIATLFCALKAWQGRTVFITFLTPLLHDFEI